MKRTIMVQKGMPIVPCLFLIGAVAFWFLMLLTDNGGWVAEIVGLDFSNLTAYEISMQILSLASPLLLFVAILFLAEWSVYWVFLALLLPIAQQIVYYICNLDLPEVLLAAPYQYCLPFLMFILFALTVLRILPTKWIFFGFCVVAALFPLVLTACGVGEFTETLWSREDYAFHDLCYWSDAFFLSAYCLAMGSYVFYLSPEKDA